MWPRALDLCCIVQGVRFMIKVWGRWFRGYDLSGLRILRFDVLSGKALDAMSKLYRVYGPKFMIQSTGCEVDGSGTTCNDTPGRAAFKHVE